MAAYDKGNNGLNKRSIRGHTPLHVACLGDKPDCVKALLVCGADVNLSAMQTSVQSTSSTPPGFIGDFINENHYKLKSEVRRDEGDYSKLSIHNDGDIT